MRKKIIFASAIAGGVVLTAAVAQQLPDQYKQLLELGMHPGYAYLDEGEDYFHNLKGPNGKTCASCHGQDASKLVGAYAHMPRYYKDIGKVADIDIRMLSCMTKYMGFPKSKDFIKKYTKKYRVPLATYVASKSNGMKIDVKLDDPQEKELYKYGEKLWWTRSGARDFSCGICHTVLSDKRIRQQALPNPVRDKLYKHWPTYRYSNDKMWTMEDRVRSCFKAFLLYVNKWDKKKDWIKKPPPYSKEVVAIELYMKHKGNGAIINVPGFIR